VHWSRYRAIHAERAARIRPELNQSSIFAYLVAAYVMAPLSRRWATVTRPRAI
jgi:hypothetical protein